MRFSFQQQVLFGIILSGLLVSGVGLTSYNAIRLQEENAYMLDHTRKVLQSIASVEKQLLTAESNVRGYIILGSRSFETPYQKASEAIDEELEVLRKLVSDNPAQVQRVDALRLLLLKRLGLLDQQVELIRKGNYSLDSIKNIVSRSKPLAAEIQAGIVRFSTIEKDLLVMRENRTKQSAKEAQQIIVAGTFIFILVICLLFYFIRKTYLEQLASEQKTREVNLELEKLSHEDQEKNWVLSGAVEIGIAIRGQLTKQEIAKLFLKRLAELSEVTTGVMYLINRSGEYFELAAHVGVDSMEEVPAQVHFGLGQLGRIAEEGASIKTHEVPAGYLKVKSGLGYASPATVLIKSLGFEGKVIALLEIAYLKPPGKRVVKLLETISDSISVAIMAARARTIMQELLEKTQLQAEELESQQEELRVTNEELSKHTLLLQVSEEELRVQQEELKQINTELEEKAFMLEEKNSTIEEARIELQRKANELENTNRFKSEFLANMSHELRTPLNSILILSRILQDNKQGRLNEEEQRYASVIYNSGNDLLTLINDILDLAKVESGKIELLPEWIKTDIVEAEIRSTFQKVAEDKGLELLLLRAPSCPSSIFVDHLRLLQILRNLISNAIKFTPSPGTVSLTIAEENETLSFEVKDTGIGIPREKQAAIFDAFQQADGSTSRKYGGTGLGLSISRELTNLFKGAITLKSEVDQGSVFTLSIPVESDVAQNNDQQREDEPLNFNPVQGVESLEAVKAVFSDDKKENRLLLIEDDLVFAEDMAAKARNSGFVVEIAGTGKEGLARVRSFNPTAIVLDMRLPDMNGEEILRKLKSAPETRTIPVHIVSAGDKNQAGQEGAIGFMQKPIDAESAARMFELLKLRTEKRNRVLLIEDDTFQSEFLKNFLMENGLDVVCAYSAAEAITILDRESVDGIILDIRLSDRNGLDLLDDIKKDARWYHLPIVINTAEDLSQADLQRVMKYAHPVVMKTRKSSERLLDEVRLFLRKVSPPRVPSMNTTMLFNNSQSGILPVFHGKKILLADDDMRNIFALSAVLEEAGFSIEIATNGLEVLDKLENVTDVDLVLMDVMMPEMDGIEATRRIRQLPQWVNLPIIAVTAKAMLGDREQCLEAGANDYISKPVDVDKLLSLIKVWLYSK